MLQQSYYCLISDVQQLHSQQMVLDIVQMILLTGTVLLATYTPLLAHFFQTLFDESLG